MSDNHYLGHKFVNETDKQARLLRGTIPGKEASAVYLRIHAVLFLFSDTTFFSAVPHLLPVVLPVPLSTSSFTQFLTPLAFHFSSLSSPPGGREDERKKERVPSHAVASYATRYPPLFLSQESLSRVYKKHLVSIFSFGQ